MPKKYECVYDGVLLDEEIEKMAAWNLDDPPHSEWISTKTFQSTKETFGLIDPVSTEVATSEREAEALVEGEADQVVNALLELDTGVRDDVLSSLPASSRWLALNFGRWRPSGRVKGDDEWEFFKSNIASFQRGAGNTGEADNYSSISFSAFAEHWNSWVANLGTSKPNVTYKSASHLQDAHKSLQKRARRNSTILPHTAGIDNLREVHTASERSQRFANQFVAAENPTRARPVSSQRESYTQTDLTGAVAGYGGAESDGDDASVTLESPAELERRLNGGRKRRRTNAKPRCRRCGKRWSLPEWKDLHKKPNNANNSQDRSQNQFLIHGSGNQVWDFCRVAESDYEEGFPRLDGLPRDVYL